MVNYSCTVKNVVNHFQYEKCDKDKAFKMSGARKIFFNVKSNVFKTLKR